MRLNHRRLRTERFVSTDDTDAKMLLLPRGITGFRDSSDAPVPLTDLRVFRSACYEAARKLGGEVVGTESHEYRNYHVVVLSLPQKRVAVLCNRHYPFLAFAEPPNEMIHDFIDVPELATVVEQHGTFQVLTAAQGNARATPESLSELSPAEMDQVKYWKPKTIGEVVFNYWD